MMLRTVLPLSTALGLPLMPSVVLDSSGTEGCLLHAFLRLELLLVDMLEDSFELG